jgi:hypothetical protein
MIIIILITSSIAVAIYLSYFLVQFKLRSARDGEYDRINNGSWSTNRRGEGSKMALRIHRARIAKWAGFGMNKEEAIYWDSLKDSKGELITHKHKYRIEGNDPDTRWWCLTVNLDGFFIPNEHNRFSYSKNDVKRENDGSWIIKLSQNKQPGNWIPLGDQNGRIKLILRCYNPNISMVGSRENTILPQIIRED